ncbi:unnamed protein product [Soboliphyme baturini]|uniref:DRBM domain-containing protein n=1 Tax=Soboliphyme baturini TaxID=241478 RepID=A0A3P8BG68_9BILA|nr:unnamed protein product [Soboliphyme baturini]
MENGSDKAVSFEGKSVLQVLNDLCFPKGDAFKPTFDVKDVSEEDVKPQDRKFSCTLTINGMTFTAVAQSKRQAKVEVARQALQELCTMKHLKCVIASEQEQVDHRTQFRAICTVGDKQFEQVGASPKEAKYRVAVRAMNEVFKLDFESSFYNPYGMVPYRLPKLVPDATKSPCQVLNEITSPKGKVVQYMELPFDTEKRVFTAVAKIDDKEFTGVAVSKKGARQDAARKLLREVFGIEIPENWQALSLAAVINVMSYTQYSKYTSSAQRYMVESHTRSRLSSESVRSPAQASSFCSARYPPRNGGNSYVPSATYTLYDGCESVGSAVSNSWPSHRSRYSTSEDSPRTSVIDRPYPMMARSRSPQAQPERFLDDSPRLSSRLANRYGTTDDTDIRGNFWPTAPQAMNQEDRWFSRSSRRPPRPVEPYRKSAETKTPLMLLNEMYPPSLLSIKLEKMSGPGDKPYYRCIADISGERFVGEGKTRRLAKHRMAVEAVAKLISRERRGVLTKVENEQKLVFPVKRKQDVLEGSSDSDKRVFVEGKSVLQVLNELCYPKGDAYKPTFHFKDLSEEDAKPQDRKFSCTLLVHGRNFKALAQSKRQAKRDAAFQALTRLFKIDPALLECNDRAEMLVLVSGKWPIKALQELCVMKHKKCIVTCKDEHVGQKMHFRVIVTVGGKRFEAKSPVEKEAKYCVAVKAMKEIFKLDFEDKSGVASGAAPYRLPKLVPDVVKSPCQILNEITSPKRIVVLYTELPYDKENRVFTIVAKIGDRQFTGAAANKKNARQEAARKLLREVFNIEVPEDWQAFSLAAVKAHLRNSRTLTNVGDSPSVKQQVVGATPYTEDSMDEALCVKFSCTSDGSGDGVGARLSLVNNNNVPPSTGGVAYDVSSTLVGPLKYRRRLNHVRALVVQKDTAVGAPNS